MFVSITHQAYHHGPTPHSRKGQTTEKWSKEGTVQTKHWLGHAPGRVTRVRWTRAPGQGGPHFHIPLMPPSAHHRTRPSTHKTDCDQVPLHIRRPSGSFFFLFSKFQKQKNRSRFSIEKSFPSRLRGRPGIHFRSHDLLALVGPRCILHAAEVSTGSPPLTAELPTGQGTSHQRNLPRHHFNKQLSPPHCLAALFSTFDHLLTCYLFI